MKGQDTRGSFSFSNGKNRHGGVALLDRHSGDNANQANYLPLNLIASGTVDE